jgi:SRSO17 transposase
MDTLLDESAQRRLAAYFDEIGEILGNPGRRTSFATYALGLLADGERKSIEPIAARACPDPLTVDAAHQRLQHFIADAKWDDRAVRRAAARHAVAAITSREPIETWIVDDTGFLKQGKHSVGVQRQYTGSAGKVTNCQIGVSLSLASASEHVPIDFELYLPHAWADDAERRREARVPDDVPFKTKNTLAIEMLARAIDDGWTKGIVLADTAYGNSSKFREKVRGLGLHYAVAVESSTKIWPLDRNDARAGDAVTVRHLALVLANRRKGFRRITWREGTRHGLSARFALHRVLPFHDDGLDPDTEREPLWLVAEWEDGAVQPTKFYFAAVPPTLKKRRLVRLLKQRWRTERVYEDLKGELGLDHFEGRRFPGWHHHVSVALCCYAFVAAERVRRFPPSPRRQEAHRPVDIAA